MPTKTYDFRGAGGGVVLDSNPFTLADNEWSDMLNVRIRNRAVSKIAGESSLMSLSMEPRHSLFIQGAGINKFYYYIDDTGRTRRIGASGSETNVTRGVGAGTELPLATNVKYQMSAISGGFSLLVNDKMNIPQTISSINEGDASTELLPLAGWEYNPAITNITCGTIRPFKNVLVAGDITQTNVNTNVTSRLGGTVRVSNLAAPGALPTWDPNAADNNTADEFELSENAEIVDMVSLGDTLCIFTPNDIYALRLNTSSYSPITVSKLLSGRGMLSSGCGVAFFGKLFVVGSEDIYVFQGGANTASVSDARVRDSFFSDLHPTFGNNTFVTHNERFDEIWVCYPSATSVEGECNMALIWNYSYNSWSRRELPAVWPGSYGPNITEGAFNFTDTHLVLPSSTSSDLKLMDDGNTFTGEEFSAFVERKGMMIDPENPTTSKWTADVAYFLTGTGTSQVSYRVSTAPGQQVDLTDLTDHRLSTYDFRIDGENKNLSIKPRENGQFMNMRISGTNDWNLHSYVVDYALSQERSR